MTYAKVIADALRPLAPGKALKPDEVPLIDQIAALWAKRAPKRVLHDPAAFFTAVRKITGPLDQVQVDTINSILRHAAHWPTAWLAYGLSTAWHEARFKSQPEWGLGKGKPYAKPGKYGQPQYGRGLVQLTWDKNYEWADKALGLAGKLLKKFDLALEPETAARILIMGMEEGAFTGLGLGRFLPDRLGNEPQFINARRIVNGTDRARDIAALALGFQDALEKGKWS